MPGRPRGRWRWREAAMRPTTPARGESACGSWRGTIVDDFRGLRLTQSRPESRVPRMSNSKIANAKLADAGRLRIEWAESRMPVLMHLRESGKRDLPLKGMKVAGCLHVTKETAVLVRTIRAAGAEVSWSGCNPLSTQDDVAAALAAEGTSIYAWHGLSTEEFYWCIDKTLEMKPTLTLDDGADLIFRVHDRYKDLAKDVIGGTEETTTGVHRLRAMGRAGKLLYPVIAVNDSDTEIKPTAALKATLDGFRVMKMDDAAKLGDIFITATGMKDVIVGRHFDVMKEGALVCNTGHYDCEINLVDLEARSKAKREIRHANEEYVLKNGRRVYVLAQGRLVNLAAAEGHPSEVMDMSFSNQYLALCRLARDGKTFDKKVYELPRELDQEIAGLKLETMGIAIDKLTPEQIAYASDYSAGT